MEYQVLLYYFYTTISDPVTFAKDHLQLCNSLNLKGRILVANEGINGTVSGLVKDTDAYMEAMRTNPQFENIMFKIDKSEGHAFKKMHVRPKKELVNLSLEDDINPLEITGRYVAPQEFYQQMQQDDTIVIDARNTYEYDLGHFKGAIRPDIETFRELPQWIRDNEQLLSNKRILTYCTGGIRCEKFSGWLKREGYDDVGQLHGGIATYGKDETVKGKDFLGQMYVFDQRLMVEVNQVEHIVVGKDYYDGTPQERMINCANPDCNRQMIASEHNQKEHLGACCVTCALHPRNRFVSTHQLSDEYVSTQLKWMENQAKVSM